MTHLSLCYKQQNVLVSSLDGCLSLWCELVKCTWISDLIYLLTHLVILFRARHEGNCQERLEAFLVFAQLSWFKFNKASEEMVS